MRPKKMKVKGTIWSEVWKNYKDQYNFSSRLIALSLYKLIVKKLLINILSK